MLFALKICYRCLKKWRNSCTYIYISYFSDIFSMIKINPFAQKSNSFHFIHHISTDFMFPNIYVLKVLRFRICSNLKHETKKQFSIFKRRRRKNNSEINSNFRFCHLKQNSSSPNDGRGGWRLGFGCVRTHSWSTTEGIKIELA